MAVARSRRARSAFLWRVVSSRCLEDPLLIVSAVVGPYLYIGSIGGGCGGHVESHAGRVRRSQTIVSAAGGGEGPFLIGPAVIGPLIHVGAVGRSPAEHI